MKPLPQRRSLIDETAIVLRQRIVEGEWNVHLPGEHALTALLQVGRNTVRSALQRLEAEGIVHSRNGKRREIITPKGIVSNRPRAVLLMSKPANEFSPSTTSWISEVHRRLDNLGWNFQVIIEPALYREKSAVLLRSITTGSPGTVWILHRSTPAMQRWFEEESLPVVLAGSRHDGITLPQVEVDLRAVSRHAAGRFLMRGHRRLAVLRPEGPYAGDAECVAAFREGALRAEVTEVRFREGSTGVVTTLRKLLRKPDRPTGLYVLHSHACVTTLSALQHEGIHIPKHLSLICREDEPYLGFLHPEPSRYRHSTRSFAMRLATLVTRPDLREAGPRARSLVMPKAISGATLAEAPVLE